MRSSLIALLSTTLLGPLAATVQAEDADPVLAAPLPATPPAPHGHVPGPGDHRAPPRSIRVLVGPQLLLPVGGLQQTASQGAGARMAAAIAIGRGVDAVVGLDYVRLIPRDTIDDGFTYDLVAGSLGVRFSRPGRVRPYVLALVQQQAARLTSPGEMVTSDGGLGLKVGAGVAFQLGDFAALVADATYASSGTAAGELGGAAIFAGLELGR
jgi:hypothetical protein